MANPEINLETHDIQGIVLSGYFHLKHSNYLFLHMDNPTAAKTWLTRIIPDITSAKYPVGPDGKVVDPPWALNIAFTAAGIEALGYKVDTFLQEFREGIVGPEGLRSKRLGDTHLNDPKNWEIGNPETPPQDVIHICLMVQTKKYG